MMETLTGLHLTVYMLPTHCCNEDRNDWFVILQGDPGCPVKISGFSWSSAEPQGTEEDIPAPRALQLLYVGLIRNTEAPRARKTSCGIKATLGSWISVPSATYSKHNQANGTFQTESCEFENL